MLAKLSRVQERDLPQRREREQQIGYAMGLPLEIKWPPNQLRINVDMDVADLLTHTER